MYLEQEQQEHKNPEIKIQKLKISKSPFSQTQQNHQIPKPQSTKSIQKYNTTNPNKKISNSEKPISSKLNPLKKKNQKPSSKIPTSSVFSHFLINQMKQNSFIKFN